MPLGERPGASYTRAMTRLESLRSRRASADNSIAIVVIAAIALLAKALLARSLMLQDASVLHALLLEGAFLIGAMCLAFLAPAKVRNTAVIVMATVLSTWLMASSVFAAYFNQVLGPLDLRFAGQAGQVGDSVLSLLSPVDLLFFADLPVLIALAVNEWLRNRRVPLSAPRKTTRVIPAAGWVVCTAVAVGLLYWAAILPEDVNSLPAATSRGVLAFQFGSLIPVSAPQRTTAAQAKPAESTSTAPARRLATFAPGAARGKNLIVIQCEAIQTFLIGAKVDGVEVTPNLNKLVRECWYFPRTYTQISRGNTSDAEWISNTGSYPPPGEAATVRWGDRRAPSLPRLMSAEGYHTVTFHANDARFWNRTNMYQALGFDEYWDRSKLGWQPRWKWGSSDETVFGKVTDEMVRLRSANTSFYAQIITMTSHYPFEFPPKEFRPYEPPAAWADTKLGTYLSSESYADKALGQFVAKLKSTGLWDESVVVLYGDHFGYLMTDHDPKSAAAEKQLFGGSYNLTQYLGIPLMVHVPGSEGGKIDDTVGQVDILATLADPLGLDLKGFTQFGRDAFVQGHELVGERGLVGSGSFLNGRALFTPGIGFDDGKAYSLADGSPVKSDATDAADYEEARAIMADSLKYSDGLPRRKNAGSTPQGIIPNRKK